MATGGDGEVGLGGSLYNRPVFCCETCDSPAEHYCANCSVYHCIGCIQIHYEEGHKVEVEDAIQDRGMCKETGSDETFEFCCSRCEGKGRVVEAKHYCTSCNEFYCDECVQIHSEISALKTHKVLGEDARQDWGQHQGSVGAGCPDHDDQTLSMYCEDHDAVCCPVCVPLDHKNCDNMSYIPKIAKGIFQSQELYVLTNSLKALRTKMECIIQEGNQMKSSLDLSRHTCLQTIADFCKRIRTIFRRLEKRAIADVDILLRKNQDAVEQVQKACDTVIGKIDKQERFLGNTSNITEQQMFFRIRDIKQELLTAQAMAKDVPALSEQDSLTFEVDKKLDTFMEDLQRIGIAKPCHSQRKKPQIAIGASHIHKASERDTIEVKLKKDKRDCCIDSMCQLKDGSVILADSMNSKLKLLNLAYQVTDQLSLPSYPTDVCSTGHSEAAVALHSNAIQFVGVHKGKLVTLRSIQLGHQCYTITCRRGKLYISEYLGKKIDIYLTDSCTILETIKNTPSMKLFSKIKCLQAMDMHNGPNLIVSDLDKGILILDYVDHVYILVSTLDFPDATNIDTMCLNSFGDLFVGSKTSDKVMQVFKKDAFVVASKPDGINNPTSILVDSIQSRLLVFQGKLGNTLLAFKLSRFLVGSGAVCTNTSSSEFETED